MFEYTVRCRNAAGSARDVHLFAPNERIACTEALRAIEAVRPGEGWVAQFALGG